MSVQTAFVESMPSPTGRMLVVTDPEGRLLAADWEDHEARLLRLLRRYHRLGAADLAVRESASAARGALGAYFEGEIGAVGSPATAPHGTAFQRAVWDELRRIPPGRTVSYGALAGRIGRPAAIRAVGLANGANPVAIFVPCHRVIGADAGLTGYGGGIERKRWLLEHEKACLAAPVT